MSAPADIMQQLLAAKATGAPAPATQAPSAQPDLSDILMAVKANQTSIPQLGTPRQQLTAYQAMPEAMKMYQASDQTLSQMPWYNKALAGIGDWFMNTTDPNSQIAQNALESSTPGSLGNFGMSQLPSVLGGIGAGKLVGPLAAKIAAPVGDAAAPLFNRLAASVLRNSAAGAAGGGLQPSSSPLEALTNTGEGAATGGLLGPVTEGAFSIPSAVASKASNLWNSFGNISDKSVSNLASQVLNKAATTPVSSAIFEPGVPGFESAPAAAAKDNGLYALQALLRSKNPELFNQRVQDNDASIRSMLNPLAPNSNQQGLSTDTMNRLLSLKNAGKQTVSAAYAPFNAIKSSVYIPTDQVSDSLNTALDGMSAPEKAMLPDKAVSLMTNVFSNKLAPLQDVEGLRSIIGGMASDSTDPTTARNLWALKHSLDEGLNNVQSLHDQSGHLLASQGEQAPLQMMQQGRAANTAFRQQFPEPSPKNTPAQNLMAKIGLNKIDPENVANQALGSSANMAAILKAANGDPTVMGNLRNYAVNDLLDSSRGSGGLLSGDKLSRNIQSNIDTYNQLFTPQQMEALNAAQQSAAHNNAILRQIMPGESGTAALLNKSNNMHDLVTNAAMSGLEHAVPGAGLAMGALRSLKSNVAQKKVEDLLTKSLLDTPTYLRLRSMTPTQGNISTLAKMLSSGMPGVAGLMGGTAVRDINQKVPQLPNMPLTP